jgi:hypothetical protein
MRAAERARLRLFGPAAGVVAVVSFARAGAPPGQYAPFGQGDVTIKDQKTGLTWQRSANAQAADFDDAARYCSALQLGGATNWRVSSYKELLTLVDESPHTEYPTGAPVQIWIDGNAFPETQVNEAYWTSSVSAAGNGAYTVSFSTGAAGFVPLNTASLYVRCVHEP